MKYFLAPAVAYLAPALYLFVLGLLATRSSKSSSLKATFSTLQNMLFLATMVASNIFFNGFYTSLRSIGLALTIFIFLLLSGILSKSGTFAIPIALSALPITAWAGFLPGFIVISILAVAKLVRVAGTDYVKTLATDTADSLGAPGILSGTSLKVSLGNLPVPDEKGLQDNSPAGEAKRIKINVSLYLGLSLAITGILSLLIR